MKLLSTLALILISWYSAFDVLEIQDLTKDRKKQLGI